MVTPKNSDEFDKLKCDMLSNLRDLFFDAIHFDANLSRKDKMLTSLRMAYMRVSPLHPMIDDDSVRTVLDVVETNLGIVEDVSPTFFNVDTTKAAVENYRKSADLMRHMVL